MHEWESRVRNIERNVNDIWEMLRRLADQVGKAQQDQRMAPGGSGSTVGGKGTKSAVVTAAITTAPDANTLGEGQATLRSRDGAALSDGSSVTVYSNFSVEIPVGTRIEIFPDGGDYKLVASDCPIAPEAP